MSHSGWFHLDVEEILAETDNAFLCETEDAEIWIPKSQIKDAGDYEDGDENVTISVTEWFVKKEGLA